MTGNSFTSTNPATGEIVWRGNAATAADVDVAVGAARKASQTWSQTPLSDRIDLLRNYGEQLQRNKAVVVETICRETGKPRWEATTEADAIVTKIDQSLEAYETRRGETSREISGALAATRYKAHGIVAVLGPFNFPGHLPAGHIIPALLAGNTLVFKPSEFTPAVGELLVKLWHDAGLPKGVLNLVQGARETGEVLVKHHDIDGVLFTGSFAAGLAINRMLADTPGKLVALEMGGNNPLVVHKVNDPVPGAYATIQSAFITAGQRCSCARRLIVPEGNDEFVKSLLAMTRRIRVGTYTDVPEPFMGPVISDAAAARLLKSQQELADRGARVLIEMKSVGARAALLSPGILDVTDVADVPDEEMFGPILQLIRVGDFDRAIMQANNTRFGLSAGLLSDDRDLYEKFYREVRAGVIHWNRPLTGATGYLPFGGAGNSGNHRPSGYFAADYCSYPVAALEVDRVALPNKLTPGITLP